MGALDLLWHWLGLFALAIDFGVLAAVGAKLFWRRRYAAPTWPRLLLAACGSAAAVMLAGFLVFERDGRMATYLSMALGVALTLAWLGRHGSR